MVKGRLVTTTTSTVFIEGGCGDIVPGADVEVKGTRQANSSIVASWIKIEDGPDQEEEEEEEEEEDEDDEDEEDENEEDDRE